MKPLCNCDSCGKDVGFTLSKRQKEGRHKGLSFTYVETLCQCKDCGNYVENPRITEADLRAFYDAYKSAAGLLTSEEIVAIRKKHGLSAERFAQLLGFGAKTVTRHENGAIQSKEADYLMRLARRDDVARELSEWSGVSLDRKKAKIPT